MAIDGTGPERVLTNEEVAGNPDLVADYLQSFHAMRAAMQAFVEIPAVIREHRERELLDRLASYGGCAD